MLGLDQIDRFARRDRQQQRPQAVAVGELRKAAGLGALAEAVERAQGNVLFVGGATPGAAQLAAGQTHHLAEIALPQGLGGRMIAGLELTNPMRDGSCGRHSI